MTEEDILTLIDTVNAGQNNECIFRIPLSAQVDFTLVWRKEPRGGLIGEGSDEFYFLKDDTGRCIGAVFDMHQDLHAVMKQEHRGQGHLTHALNTVILPHIRQREPDREEQKLTFLDPELARRCAKKWGFTMTGELSATKRFEDITAEPPRKFEGRPVTRDEFSLMRRRIDQARLYLVMVREQLEMSCGSSSDVLEWMINDLSNLDDEVEDHIESTQGRLVNSMN